MDAIIETTQRKKAAHDWVLSLCVVNVIFSRTPDRLRPKIYLFIALGPFASFGGSVELSTN